MIINDIDEPKAEVATAEINQTYGTAICSAFDITQTDTTIDHIAELDAKHGGIDILINNAGNAGSQASHQIPFKDIPVEHWDAISVLTFTAYSIAPKRY